MKSTAYVTDSPKSTKDVIFENAVLLFSQKGYHGTSMRDIARKVGIKESSLYNHYAGKGAILQAVLDYQTAAFEGSIDALEELKKITGDITDPVEFWLAGADVFIKHTPPLMEPISRILINEMFLNDQCRKFCLHSMYASQKDLTEMIFRVMYEKGMIKKCDFKMMAVQYVYMLQGLEIENKLLMMEGHSADEIKRNLYEHISLFIGGMRKQDD